MDCRHSESRPTSLDSDDVVVATGYPTYAKSSMGARPWTAGRVMEAATHMRSPLSRYFFFFQAEDGIRDLTVTGVQTCALPIFRNNSTDFPPGVCLARNFLRLMNTSLAVRLARASWIAIGLGLDSLQPRQIGRASCRERV